MRTYCACLLLLLCIGCDDRSRTPQVPTAAEEATDNPSAVALLPESRFIAVTNTDGAVRLWGVGADGAMTGQVARATFSPDGKLLQTADPQGRVLIWDTHSGQLVTGEVAQAWSGPLPRYDSKRIDNMPQVGPDNFKILQDQIDALENRVRKLEEERDATTRP